MKKLGMGVTVVAKVSKGISPGKFKESTITIDHTDTSETGEPIYSGKDELGKRKYFTKNEVISIQEAKMTKKQLIESGITKITRKVIAEGNRDTTWAVKMIEDFIASNENIDQDKEYGGSPSMKLFGAAPSKNFNITFDELRAFAALLRRMNRGAKK